MQLLISFVPIWIDLCDFFSLPFANKNKMKKYQQQQTHAYSHSHSFKCVCRVHYIFNYHFPHRQFDSTPLFQWFCNFYLVYFEHAYEHTTVCIVNIVCAHRRVSITFLYTRLHKKPSAHSQKLRERYIQLPKREREIHSTNNITSLIPFHFIWSHFVCLLTFSWFHNP